MRLDVMSIPIALTTFIPTPEPISIFKGSDEVSNNAHNQHKELFYFTPVKIDPFLELKNKIHSFELLTPNWDSNGGFAPNRTIINNSLRFLTSISESTLTALSKENIVVTPYGTIVLDFESENNIVSVEIGESKIGFFTDFSNEELNPPPFEGAIFNQNNLPIELLSALNKLFLLEEAEA